jgi:hypothetical protein
MMHPPNNFHLIQFFFKQQLLLKLTKIFPVGLVEPEEVSLLTKHPYLDPILNKIIQGY